jgi:hypothetical protein
MANLNAVSEEILSRIEKSTAGVLTSTGIAGLDLSDLISLVPVNSPFRDMLARTTPQQGAQYAQWEALTNVNNTQPNPATAFDYAGPLVNVNKIQVGAAFAKISAGYTVTKDAVTRAGGYADAKAVAIFNAINQFKIGEDKMCLGGQNFALTTPSTPTVTTSATGGSIAASTAVNVIVTARTGANFYWGGSTVGSSQGTVTTSTTSAATHSATATWPAVIGAVGYDVWVAGFYYTTVTVNTVLITSVPVANATSVPNIPNLYTVPPTSIPTADLSAGANQFNGILATLAGDYANPGSLGLVQRGSGVNSGAYFQSLDGAPLTISGTNIVELDELNQNIYNQVQLSPTAYMVSAQESVTITKALLGSTASTTFFDPGDSTARVEAVLGASVTKYINKITGQPIRIELMPNQAPGTIIARTDAIPFPNSNITNSVELRCQEDLTDWEYAAGRIPNTLGGGPRWDGEVYSTETFLNRSPVAMAVLQNVGASA